MKFKTTRNELTATGLPIVKIPYCCCQTLLKFQEPIAFNAGLYGWNYDVYKINNTLVVTGYSMTVKGIEGKYYDDFEKRSKKINNSCQDYDTRVTWINELLIEWLKQEMNG